MNPVSFRISLMTTEMAKDGPNCMRPSAAETRILRRCEVLAADLDHHGVHKSTPVSHHEHTLKFCA